MLRGPGGYVNKGLVLGSVRFGGGAVGRVRVSRGCVCCAVLCNVT